MRTRLSALLMSLLVVLVAACSTAASPSPSPSEAASVAPTATPEPTPEPTAAPFELTVFGATSLKAALEEQAKFAYEAAVPNATVTISTGASSALSAQIIEGGAPADVFLSADIANAQKVVDADLVDGEIVEFVNNRLVIITPADNPAGITTPYDLGKDGLRIVTATEEVPIRRYADELVANLAALPGAPAGFAEAYAANLLPGVENVGAVRAAVEIGEADAAIVYVTDAFTSGDKVQTIEVPDEANPVAEYGGVAIKEGEVEEAHAFIDWVIGPVGQSIFGAFGFLPPA